MSIESKIETFFLKNDNYIFGYADMSGLLDKKYQKFNSAISIGRKLNFKIIDSLKDGPNQQYHVHYHEINHKLTKICLKITQILNKANIDHLAIQPTFKDEELDENIKKTLRTDFSHKMDLLSLLKKIWKIYWK